MTQKAVARVRIPKVPHLLVLTPFDEIIGFAFDRRLVKNALSIRLIEEEALQVATKGSSTNNLTFEPQQFKKPRLLLEIELDDLFVVDTDPAHLSRFTWTADKSSTSNRCMRYHIEVETPNGALELVCTSEWVYYLSNSTHNERRWLQKMCALYFSTPTDFHEYKGGWLFRLLAWIAAARSKVYLYPLQHLLRHLMDRPNTPRSNREIQLHEVELTAAFAKLEMQYEGTVTYEYLLEKATAMKMEENAQWTVVFPNSKGKASSNKRLPQPCPSPKKGQTAKAKTSLRKKPAQKPAKHKKSVPPLSTPQDGRISEPDELYSVALGATGQVEENDALPLKAATQDPVYPDTATSSSTDATAANTPVIEPSSAQVNVQEAFSTLGAHFRENNAKRPPNESLGKSEPIRKRACQTANSNSGKLYQAPMPHNLTLEANNWSSVATSTDNRAAAELGISLRKGPADPITDWAGHSAHSDEMPEANHNYYADPEEQGDESLHANPRALWFDLESEGEPTDPLLYRFPGDLSHNYHFLSD